MSDLRTFELEEAAKFVGVHPHTLEGLARAGEAPAAKIGKRWIFIDVDLAEWLRSRYRKKPEQTEGTCRSNVEIASGGASGRSAAEQLQKALAQKIGRGLRNTTTAAVPPYTTKSD